MSVKVSVGGGTQILPNARDVQKRIDAARPSLVLTNAGDNHWNYQSQGIIVTSNVSMWGTDFSRYPDNKPIQFSQSDSLRYNNMVNTQYGVQGNSGTIVLPVDQYYLDYRAEPKNMGIIDYLTQALADGCVADVSGYTITAYQGKTTRTNYIMWGMRPTCSFVSCSGGYIRYTVTAVPGLAYVKALADYTAVMTYPLFFRVAVHGDDVAYHNINLSSVPFLKFQRDNILINDKYNYSLSTSDSGGTHLDAVPIRGVSDVVRTVIQ